MKGTACSAILQSCSGEACTPTLLILTAIAKHLPEAKKLLQDLTLPHNISPVSVEYAR